METLHAIIRRVAQQLSIDSQSPRLEAELLVANVMGETRTALWIHSDITLSTEQQKTIFDHMNRRLNGEPMAYILGYREFWSRHFHVTPGVFIPRPETEMLVEWVLNHFPKAMSIRVADLGTGSGAIALALASERPHWQIDAIDNSSQALGIAQRNAQLHGCLNVHFHVGNWCSALARRDYDVIISNPPYIEEDDLHLENLRYEPRAALVAGQNGLSALEEIVASAQGYLRPGGYLLLEHGFNQGDAITELMDAACYVGIHDYLDLAGCARMMVGRVPKIFSHRDSTDVKSDLMH